VADPNNKGTYQTEIPQELLNEAMRSVERHKGGSRAMAEEAEPEPPAEQAQGPELEVELPEPPAAASAELEAALAESRREVEELRAQLELSQAKGREMMERMKESHERALRTTADLENYRRRAQREKEEVQKFGTERLIKDFLPVVDNLDRALQAARSSADFDSLRTGVDMTRKLFESALGRHGVKPFSAVGKPFDPHVHEAMQHVETAEVPAGHVAYEAQRGYMLHDRLMRPALVAVARAPAAAPAEPAPAPSNPESSAEGE
jgi:molecular chaperone GrpE